MRQALSDLRVVELGTGVAASWCGKAFADLGADVVKVEPPGGDRLRSDAGVFAHLGTNKRSIVLESGSSTADSLWELLAGVDLVIEAPGLGALRDWGINAADVLSRQPATSVVCITGFGATGPYADYAWSDIVVQAFAGSLIFSSDGYVRLPMSIEECAVGHTAAMGGLAAVLRARATGAGAFIDCAATEALASVPARMGRHLGWEYHDREDAKPQASNASTTLLPNGVFPCGDGFVAMMMTPQQLQEMLHVLDSPELTETFSRPDAFSRGDTKEVLDGVMYPWLLSRTRQEITEVAQAAGWPVAPVNEPDEVLIADHLHQRGFWVHAFDSELGPLLLPGAPYRHTEGGWKIRRGSPRLGQSDSPTGAGGDVQEPAPAAVAGDSEVPPLRGLRVLDLTTVWSGPLLTVHLADLGAEVIRIETPRVFPPTTRGYTPRPDPQVLLSTILGGYAPQVPGEEDRPFNRHAMYNSVNRGKLSCTLDVRDPEQRDLFFRLVAESDIFVENLKSTTLHQMGIHETELLKANPRIIVLRIPPAGLSGDWAHYTGFGQQFDGLTGLASLCGNRGTDLMDTPTTMHMDGVTGPAGVFALLAALHYRAATGRGQVIELAQSENVLAQLGDVFVNLQLGEKPQRFGNRDKYRAPQGLYTSADERLVALTVNDDAAWVGLTSVLGRSDLAEDPRLRGVAGRQAAHDELDEAITAWVSSVGADDAFRLLQGAGVAAAVLHDERSFVEDPQVAARGWIQPLHGRDVGTFPHLGHAFSGIPLAWDRGAPALGEHNEYVFKDLLGLSDDDYQLLVKKRVATEDYVDSEGNPY